MVFGELMRDGSGFMLWGSSADLHDIYEFVHSVVDKDEGTDILSEDTIVLALAYDARKAFGGYRDQMVSGLCLPSHERVLYGVHQNWVTFIYQIALLRTCLRHQGAYCSGRTVPTVMTTLEGVLKEQLAHAYAGRTEPLLKTCEGLTGQREDHLREDFLLGLDRFLSLDAPQRLPSLYMTIRLGERRTHLPRSHAWS